MALAASARNPYLSGMNSVRARDLFVTLFQSHPWHGVPAHFSAAGIYNAYVEIVPEEAVKYELDKVSGHLRIDRPQLFSSNCPTLYGFIPQTYCGASVAERCAQRTQIEGIEGDGDPLDICILTEKSISHGNFLCSARPIGGLRMIDGNEADDKIIAILEADIAYGHMRDISDCPVGVIDRLKHYFLSYKQRPDDPKRKVSIAHVYDRAEALEVIQRSIADYRQTFGEPEGRVGELRRVLAP
jgi:inorganic pyrophosphatase